MTIPKSTPPSSAGPDASILAEARRWSAIMRDDSDVADNLAAFSDWIEADDRHLAAFEMACGEPQIQAQAQAQPRPAARIRRRWAPLALAACLAVIAALPALRDRPHITVPAGIWESRAPGDGSALQFGPGSRAWMNFTDHKRAIRLDSGSVIVDAAKDPARPMIVETVHGSVRVIGTRFTVIVDATGTEVSVTRGKVEATSAGMRADSAPVTAAQRVRLSAEGLTRQAVPVPEPEEIHEGWRSLTAAPLADLAAAVEAETGRPLITLPSAAARSGPISGRFFVRDAEATIALLTSAYKLRRMDAPLGLTVLY